MLVQQYAHRLPADYPMERIRERIAARAPLWDATPGLAFKAFLIRERGTNGATANVYASIYLWRDTSATLDFFTDDRFAGVIGTFGRPAVETALPLASRVGGEARDVGWLTCAERLLEAGTNLRALREAETAHVAESVTQPGVLAAVSALDTAGWRLVRYVLSRAPEERSDAVAYQVAHLAHPGWASLEDRRS